ncbi:hypothetical protein COU61_00550 [Candidatus Pacearchaeota archaeon CG10_big_fil_rev_8_21_14_0_10_35_13]|nr:MAG: hypothetical protein COU61_00550 [Candidatus Pacearchaeota archaeon CG10_big_fil_rev_8_21_14_0_10_35_13]
MNNKTTTMILGIILAISIISLTSALTVQSVSVQEIQPGKEASVTVNIENNLKSDVRDVSVNLQLGNTQFIAVGSSEDSQDKIKEGNDESFSYTIKASKDIKPGDYSIPFIIRYEYENKTIERSGTFGVTVKANPELSYTISTENAVVGNSGKITLKIINTGLGEAKFLTVRIFPSGYTLLSEETIYIGSVGSDDYETASFDVVFNDKNSLLSASIEYKDFDNKQVIKTVNLPIKVYTQEEALQLGIITKSNTGMYIIVAIIIIIIWYAWKKIKKNRRIKKSMEGNGR